MMRTRKILTLLDLTCSDNSILLQMLEPQKIEFKEFIDSLDKFAFKNRADLEKSKKMNEILHKKTYTVNQIYRDIDILQNLKDDLENSIKTGTIINKETIDEDIITYSKVADLIYELDIDFFDACFLNGLKKRIKALRSRKEYTTNFDELKNLTSEISKVVVRNKSEKLLQLKSTIKNDTKEGKIKQLYEQSIYIQNEIDNVYDKVKLKKMNGYIIFKFILFVILSLIIPSVVKDEYDNSKIVFYISGLILFTIMIKPVLHNCFIIIKEKRKYCIQLKDVKNKLRIEQKRSATDYEMSNNKLIKKIDKNLEVINKVNNLLKNINVGK